MSLVYFREVVRMEELAPTYTCDGQYFTAQMGQTSEEYYIPLVPVRQQGSAKVLVVPTSIFDYSPVACGSG